MAEENEQEKPVKEKDEFSDERKTKGSGRSSNFYLVIIIIFNVIIMAGVYSIIIYINFFTQKEKMKEEVEFNKIIEQDKNEVLGPLYILEPFKVNLSDPGGNKMAKVIVELEFFNEDSLAEAEIITPRIRNIIINLISAKRSEDLMDIKGKLFLRDQIMRSINARLKKGGVRYVYFSKFVMQ